MSAVLVGLLKCTVGFLCGKVRDRVATQLKDGELTDETCRQLIVRELDDIKTKLDGLSKKELLASISFFKEGFIRLYSSLDTSSISHRDEVGTLKRDGASSATKCQNHALERASELSKAFGSLKITSQERYKSAKKSFEESKKLATVAFNNEALGTEDRLLASILRIVSRILECLDDPEAAFQDCLLYLEELQNLHAIQDMISLWMKREKDITDQLRVCFNKKKRSAAIESMQMINTLLVELAMKSKNINMGIFDWPKIEIAKSIYHPIFDDRAVLKNVPGIYEQAPWIWRFGRSINVRCCALTGKGEILSLTETRDALAVTRRGVEYVDMFYKIPSIQDKVCALNIDENDNVYVLKRIVSIESDIWYKLLTLDANGNVKADRFLEIIDAKQMLMTVQMSVVQDGIVIIYCKGMQIAYICHSTDGKKDYKLTLPLPDAKSIPLSLTVSNKNHIIVVLGNAENKAIMCIMTLDKAKLKLTVEIPIMIETSSQYVLSVVFNRANQQILVLYCKYDEPASFDPFDLFEESEACCATTTTGKLYTFSDTGVLLHSFEIPWKSQEGASLKSNPNGVITLVKDNGAIMLNKENVF